MLPDPAEIETATWPPVGQAQGGTGPSVQIPEEDAPRHDNN